MTNDPQFQQYLDNMRVAQARIHKGDANWWIVNASGYEVKGPWVHRAEAEGALKVLQGRYDWDAEDEADEPANPPHPAYR